MQPTSLPPARLQPSLRPADRIRLIGEHLFALIEVLVLATGRLCRRYWLRLLLFAPVAAMMVFVPLMFRHACDDSNHVNRLSMAQSEMKQLVWQAYPRWLIQQPEATCPGTAAELFAYTHQTDLRDPWGNPYVVICVADAGIQVASAGQDRQLGSNDDLFVPEKRKGWLISSPSQ